MWVVDYTARANVMMKEDEGRRARLVSEARRSRGENGSGRAWSWRVEPGMEEAFEDLQGWLLSSQRVAEAETPAPAVGAAATGDEPHSRATRQSPVRPGWAVPVCCGVACCAA